MTAHQASTAIFLLWAIGGLLLVVILLLMFHIIMGPLPGDEELDPEDRPLKGGRSI